jgi:hypothetical protein
MAGIIRWSPFREMVDMQGRLDHLFEEMTKNLEGSEWTETGNWLALKPRQIAVKKATLLTNEN